jgi:hypothetical protein
MAVCLGLKNKAMMSMQMKTGLARAVRGRELLELDFGLMFLDDV